MDQAQRPGGLTAIAIINFVLAGMGLLSVGMFTAAPSIMGLIPTKHMSAEEREKWEEQKELMNRSDIKLFATLDVIPAILLVTAGIGYLKQKRIMGRVIGNVYALVAISLIVIAFIRIDYDELPGMKGMGFLKDIGSLIGLVYPVITLIVLNTVFKEDFPN